MENLPTELHMQIIAFCNECELEDRLDVPPGSSIRALRSVSRYFATVSQPWLYHTVSLCGILQATMLLQRLELESSSRIHNLFLSDDIQPAQEPPPGANPKTPAGNKSALCALPAPLNRTPSLSSATLATLTRLLTLSAPSLRVLSISITSSSSPTLFARLFRMRFPELRSINISGFYPFPSTPTAFPKLKAMSLSGNPNPTGLLAMGALEDSCPSLETLEVRGVKRSSGFMKEVEQVVWTGILGKGEESNPVLQSYGNLGEDEEEVFHPRLPKTVRNILIQNLADTNDVLPPTPRVRQYPVSSPSHPHGVHLTLLSPSPAPSHDQLRSEWMIARA